MSLCSNHIIRLREATSPFWIAKETPLSLWEKENNEHWNFTDKISYNSIIYEALPGEGPMLPIWILKRLVLVFINACRFKLLALLSLSQFGRGRLSLVAISFYALLLLFGPCRLSEFTLAGPHISFSSGLITWWQKSAFFIPKNIRSCLAKQGQEVLQVTVKLWYKF